MRNKGLLIDCTGSKEKKSDQTQFQKELVILTYGLTEEDKAVKPAFGRCPCQ